MGHNCTDLLDQEERISYLVDGSTVDRRNLMVPTVVLPKFLLSLLKVQHVVNPDTFDNASILNGIKSR